MAVTKKHFDKWEQMCSGSFCSDSSLSEMMGDTFSVKMMALQQEIFFYDKVRANLSCDPGHLT